MPVTPTYPGVYIQEVSSGVRTISSVATSITAFLGYFKRGPMNQAVEVLGMADFERNFGGLVANSEAAYAIQQFFLNGGGDAWVIRTAKTGTAKKAAIVLANTGGTALITASAANEGAWGNNVRIDVDYSTTDPDSLFNLIATEYGTVGGKLQPVATEVFRNLIIDAAQPNDLFKVVNDGSKLVKLEAVGNPTGQRPAQTGTVSGPFWDQTGVATMLAGLNSGDSMTATFGVSTVSITLGPPPTPRTMAWLTGLIQTQLRTLTGLENATVAVPGSLKNKVFLQIKPGSKQPADLITFSGALATKLNLTGGTSFANVQQYALGSSTVAGAQQLPLGVAQPGVDGDLPTATELIGQEIDKSGIWALQNVDLFNILCIPDTAILDDSQANLVAAAAETYCEKRRAFYILDVPQVAKVRDEPPEIQAWLDANASLRHKNAALYYPRPYVANPLEDFRLRPIAASGTMAGLYARTDAERGVWKAPAGTEAVIRGAQKLEYPLTDPENGLLNPLAINCLRNFPVYGMVSWGARTLDGADQQASEWKYIPVRRLALYLEESLYRGLKWVVFEPNDEPLWAQIRLNVGAFMHDLFRKGAFQGKTPQEAYLVKCDSETTTQNDINLGIVNILVGFAPLKPAEFVIITIRQLAGQVQV